MKVDTWKCDICKVQKAEANHWFHGHLLEGAPLIVPWGVGLRIGGSIEKFSTTQDWAAVAKNPRAFVEIKAVLPITVPWFLTESDAAAHFCGLEHAIQWISQKLGTK